MTKPPLLCGHEWRDIDAERQHAMICVQYQRALSSPEPRMSLLRLRASYAAGLITDALTLDNDQAIVYQGDECVFEMHPRELLEAALDLLGIPHAGA